MRAVKRLYQNWLMTVSRLFGNYLASKVIPTILYSKIKIKILKGSRRSYLPRFSVRSKLVLRNTNFIMYGTVIFPIIT